MTKEELDELLGTMTKEELKENLARVSQRRQQLEEELRDFKPPSYFTQRDINAEREQRRKEIEAHAAFERQIDLKIFSLGLRRLT
jgi:hypothetical protein